MELELETVLHPNIRDDISLEFPVIDTTISYTEFVESYFLKNQGCLIKNIGNSWKAHKLWVQNNQPNFSYLKTTYGEKNVQLQDCNKAEYSQRMLTEQTFGEYLEYWENYIENDYSVSGPLYYLKDWHLANESNEEFYQVPEYFASDWLNEYLVENTMDDYRFVYMGAKGTWTPFHADVMTSYSWSANVCGQKRWLLFPPGEEVPLRDSFNNFPSDVSNIENLKCFEVIQNPGDAIFVPSNWYHQVWNTKDTISINHNWINGCNLKFVWQAMTRNLTEVKEEIEDCSDMEGFLDHCQIMLRASFCMNFEGFLKFILYIANKRVDLLRTGRSVFCNNWKLGMNHAIFDLEAIKDVLLIFIDRPDVNETTFKDIEDSSLTLLTNVENALDY